MKTFTAQVTDDRWDRWVQACLPVPLDKETKEPTMSENAWAKKNIKLTLDIDMLKKEKHKARYVPVPINDDDFTIT